MLAPFMLAQPEPESYLGTAVDAIRGGGNWRAVLDAFPVPVYTTDGEGAVTYWNQACVAFAGRQPQLGSDKWCVTWELYTMTGERLPHAQCPMAEAVKKRRAVRGKVAIALRPDGTRRAFRPYPTPLFDADGNFAGAVNVLIDVSHEQAVELANQAARCRRLALATTDTKASEILANMAREYGQAAATLKSAD